MAGDWAPRSVVVSTPKRHVALPAGPGKPGRGVTGRDTSPATAWCAFATTAITVVERSQASRTNSRSLADGPSRRRRRHRSLTGISGSHTAALRPTSRRGSPAPSTTNGRVDASGPSQPIATAPRHRSCAPGGGGCAPDSGTGYPSAVFIQARGQSTTSWAGDRRSGARTRAAPSPTRARE